MGEKLRDNKVPSGKVLTPFGIETCGRLWKHAEAFLARLQVATTSRARLRGGHACAMVRRLREKIDAHLHRCAATVCAHAEDGVSGSLLYRPLPLAMEAVIERLAPVPTWAGQEGDPILARGVPAEAAPPGELCDVMSGDPLARNAAMWEHTVAWDDVQMSSALSEYMWT